MKSAVLFYLLLCINKTTLQISLAMQIYHFSVSKMGYRSKSLDGLWKVKSRTQCLTKCLSSYKDACQSFMYNTATLYCTPGTSIHHGLLSASSPDEELYVLKPEFRTLRINRPTVNITIPWTHHVPGRIGMNLSTSICAAYFPTPSTYFVARDICRAYDAYLFVPRSAESYALFKSMIDPTQRTWVGLNDVEIQGKYMADDDGQEMDISSIQSLFVPGQPNYGKQQHCIATYTNCELDDTECDNALRFVCQTDFSKC